MIDIKLLRKDPDFFKRATRDKGYSDSTVDEVIRLDKELRKLINNEDDLRSKRKSLSAQDRKQSIELKDTLKKVSEKRQLVQVEFNEKIILIPNPAFQDVPVGKDEKENKILRKWHAPRDFTFQPKNHLELGESLGILNFSAGAKVAGAQFYYLDNEGAFLELALVQFTLHTLKKHGFIASITPDLARSQYYLGTGYLPKGDEAQIYTIEEEDLGLIATAEITLAARHSDETFNEEDLPVKYAGVSHCFRKEAGAYGKYSKGLYRVHQFTKVEMFIYTAPEDSEKIHKEMLAIEEEIWQKLEIPYQVLEMCTGDLGSMAARKYDIEAWMPGRDSYGEVTSTSNCTDFQARNLKIKVKNIASGTQYLHLLNGTAIAVSRAIIAILENNQNEDGSINIPEVLVPYMGGITKIEVRDESKK